MIWMLVSAFAADAEGARLQQELHRLVVNAQWEGVDRTYRKMVRNHPTSLEGTLHVAAANASFQRGDLLAATHRLERVLAGDEVHGDAVATLERIRSLTGLVVVQGAKAAELKAMSPPLDPRMRQAILAATTALASDGVFVGLLPAGEYTLDDAPFRVLQGTTWTLLP